MAEHKNRLVVMLEHIEDEDANECSCGYALANWRLGGLDVCSRCLETLTRRMDEDEPKKELRLN